MEILLNTTRRVEGGWETGLLWKKDNPPMPDSRKTAERRLKTIEGKLKADPVFAQTYLEKIQEYRDKGFARPVTLAEKQLTERLWYLPHFHAVNPKKPNKVRLVFDAKAQTLT